MKVLVELLKEINVMEEKMLAKYPNNSAKILEVMGNWRALIFKTQEAKK